jgi:ABC-2 type transport system permease protein
MKNKLKYLIKNSLSKKIKSKTFIFTNLFFLILAVGLINIDQIIKLFDNDKSDLDRIQVVYIEDKTNKLYDDYKIMLESNFEAAGKMVEVSPFEGNMDIITKDNDDWVITIDYDKDNYLKANLTSYEKLEQLEMNLVFQTTNQLKIMYASSKENLKLDIYSKVYSEIELTTNVLRELKDKEEEKKNDLFGVAFTIIIMPFFMATMFVLQMVGAEVNEEKVSKSMEIIIGNVTPLTHLSSKVISANLFIIIQGILLVFYVGLGLLIRTIITGKNVIASFFGEQTSHMVMELIKVNTTNELILVIVLVVLLLMLTILAYSVLAGVIASMTTNMEDFQQLQGPLVMISLIGYYLTFAAPIPGSGPILKVASYIPLISSMLSPALFAVGTVGIMDIIISIIVLILFLVLIAKYGMKIYKVGILNYSSTGLWKKMLKAMKS